jgi:methylated-DNA-[protein]-cysteine S-methyltransferase
MAAAIAIGVDGVLLQLEEEGGALTCVRFRAPSARKTAASPTPLLEEAERQLRAYLAGERRHFDLPLLPRGTGFQKQVWQTLSEIAYGETRTYGEIARAIGRPGAARAVGAACALNPLVLVIPCHRAVGAKGALAGYAGGVDLKRRLLDLEMNAGMP